MEFFSATDYRKAISHLIERNRARGQKTNLSRLAEAVRVQLPYLSKVMNGQADLNSDQLFLVCKFFELRETEAEYLQLLLEHSRTQLKEKREILKRKIQAMQAQGLDIRKHVEAREMSTKVDPLSLYYLNPLLQVVHVALNIPNFQNLDHLARVLNVSREQITDAVRAIEDLGFIEFKGGKYVVTDHKLHLPKESHLLGPYQSLIRLQSMQQQQRSRNSGNYTFNVTFSADEDGRARILGVLPRIPQENPENRRPKWIKRRVSDQF